jgi:hypothetical protein
MRVRPHIEPLPADHPAPPDQPSRLESDKTRPAVDRVRETLAVGINIQATGEATNAVVTGMVKCLLDHIDELEADLNCAVAVGRMAGSALKPLLLDKRITTELADAAEGVLLTTPAERQDPRVWFGRVDALKLAIKVARGEIPHGASAALSHS